MRLLIWLMTSLLAATLPATTALAQGLGALQFHPEPIIDRAQGGLSAGAFMVPNGWKTTGGIQWNYAQVSWPVRGAARIEAPDGSAWVESYPAELFYSLEPRETQVAVGGSALGMIHWPGTETVKNPYYGTSEQSSANAYHWTDGSGSYQHSNDPNFDPNRSSNGNWQRMERTR